MTDYSELVNNLRLTEMVCRDRMDGQVMLDAAAAIEGLQSEVKRLKDSNDELREAQTYIDHYGDKWMTSAKDVPTAAYEHGYMDGRIEARANMEVQDGSISKFADGEWWKEARE